ncbi:MAG: hypothetical protein JRJ29_00675 [Deltaproteobacteria bacterium]|nr:hypothetical protein [Deltaproteobacteria bacterium]
MMADEMSKERMVKVSLVQQGPSSENKAKNIEGLLKIIEGLAEKEKPDFVLLGELATIPYVGAVLDKKYFDWAEPIPGPTTEILGKMAAKFEMHLIIGIFEKAPVEGVYYNSLVILGPDGEIVKGVFPDGTSTLRYSKSHIPYSVRDPGRYNETFYFTPGAGWPIFHTHKGKVGLTICYDRHFPEPFRILALQGAEIIFNPSVAMAATAIKDGASMADIYLTELRAHAVANSVWVCAVNKAGTEVLQGQETVCYGNSAVIDPTGKIRALGPGDTPSIITCTINLQDVAATRHFFRYIRARRPHLYRVITREDHCV